MYQICRNCGRKLSDPVSIKRGFGPECWRKVKEKTLEASKASKDIEDIPGQMDIFDFPETIPDDKEI